MKKKSLDLTLACCLLSACLLSGCMGGGGGSSEASPTGNANNQPASPPPFEFVPSTNPFTINWDQFGDFSFPAETTVVYMGPSMNNDSLQPLKHGFSHICAGSTPPSGMAKLLPSQRAILWSTVAGSSGSPMVGTQPWGTIMSPWNNNLPLYQTYWSVYYLKNYASMYPDTVGQNVPNVDLLVSDMEKSLTDPTQILALKNSPQVPSGIKALPDADFIDLYKRNMAAIHNSAHDYAIAQGFQGKLGSYGEPPIRRTWWGIFDHTWQEWTTNPNNDLLSYLLGDYNSSNPNWSQIPNGPFYNNCNPIHPSAYYFYNYPTSKSANPSLWQGAGNYLSYTLFQIEANRAWTNKPQIEWLYLRYHPSSTDAGKFIQPWMAHNAAIFPLLAGAGIWLYDYYPGFSGGDPSLNYSTYEYFVYGLYRVAQYAYMLEKPFETYMPMNPRDAMVQHKPVWRGLVNHGKMLVAAHNPYADLGDVTVVDIDYLGTSLGSIQLKGLETALVLFDLP